MLPEESPLVEDVTVAPAPEPYPFWGWMDMGIAVGLLVGLFVVILFAAGGLMYYVPWLKTNQAPLMLIVQLVAYLAVYATLWAIFHFGYNRPVFASLAWRRTVSNRTLAYIGLCGVLLSPAVSLLASVFHTPEVQIAGLDELQKYPVILALFGVMAVTAAPLFEELLFRGFLQPVFIRTFGAIAGILITSSLFGLLHIFEYQGLWQYAAVVTLVGAILGTVRYRTNSLIPSTLMHACYNSVAAVGIFFHHK